MKFFCKKYFLLIPVVSLVFIIGCGGFEAGGTVSPAMFLLPGFGKVNSTPISITTNSPDLTQLSENSGKPDMDYFIKQ